MPLGFCSWIENMDSPASWVPGFQEKWLQVKNIWGLSSTRNQCVTNKKDQKAGFFFSFLCRAAQIEDWHHRFGDHPASKSLSAVTNNQTRLGSIRLRREEAPEVALASGADRPPCLLPNLPWVHLITFGGLLIPSLRLPASSLSRSQGRCKCNHRQS